MQHIPRCMSTQHPDNVTQPFFVEGVQIGGEDEIQEAFYAYSHLGCDEQMWDYEGKEVDQFVVKKLLTKNEAFFKEKKLGRDVRLTVRVPNPEFEKAEGKILLETLESLPRSYDAARLFYGENIAPIFEVILPMATSAKSLGRIYHYYKDIVAGKQHSEVRPGDITIGEWIGEFGPQEIQVIPLFEDEQHMLGSADILEEYLKDKDVEYQRVFLARSDPAVNYGSISAVILNKIALQRLHRLSERRGIPIYPILGAGSAPFRGNLRPQTVDSILKGYPSVQTFTIQSSFKFDHQPAEVSAAVAKLMTSKQKAPIDVDEDKLLEIMKRYVSAYQSQLKTLAPAINKVARSVPSRRRRKLHVGLFGYSRKIDEVKLPRAIKLTASSYSLGVPPELLGLNALTDEDFSVIEHAYPSIKFDLQNAYQFANMNSDFFPRALKGALPEWLTDMQTNPEHAAITTQIIHGAKESAAKDLSTDIISAAHVRGFLG